MRIVDAADVVEQKAPMGDQQVRSVWEQSDIGAERSRVMKLTHELRSTGPCFLVSAVWVAPPCCIAIVSVQTARALRERQAFRRPLAPRRRQRKALPWALALRRQEVLGPRRRAVAKAYFTTF